MDFNIIAEVPLELEEFTKEIRLALGLEPQKSHLTIYRRFQMEEFSDELDLQLIEFFKRFPPFEVNISGRLSWKEENGFLAYHVNVPSQFMEIRQELLRFLKPEIPGLIGTFEPHITLGNISRLGRNQRDLVDNLYFPQTWTVNRLILESEKQPGNWILEAGYSLGF